MRTTWYPRTTIEQSMKLSWACLLWVLPACAPESRLAHDAANGSRDASNGRPPADGGAVDSGHIDSVVGKSDAQAAVQRRRRPQYDVVSTPPSSCRQTLNQSKRIQFVEHRSPLDLLNYVPTSAAAGFVDGDDVLDVVVQGSVQTSTGETGYAAHTILGDADISSGLGPFLVGGPRSP